MEQVQNYAQLTVPLTIPVDRWASGKLLGNATDSCAGATESPLASLGCSVPRVWKRAYSASGAAAHGCWQLDSRFAQQSVVMAMSQLHFDLAKAGSGCLCNCTNG